MMIEKKILRNLIATENNIKKCREANITEAYFQHQDTKWLFLVILWHYDKYKTVLQSDSLESALRQSQKMSQDEKVRVGALFQEVSLLDMASNFSILLDEFQSYFKTNEVAKLLERATEPLHTKNPDKSLELIKSSLLQLDKTFNRNTEDSGFFGKDVDNRIKSYLEQEQFPEKFTGVPMGFQEIDKRTKGLKRGTLSIVIGSEKSAKSVLLVNIARNAVTMGKRVLYHVNEGGKQLVEERFAASSLNLILDHIQEAKLSSEDRQKYFNFLEDYRNKNQLFIDSIDAQHSTVAHLEQKILDMLTSGPVDLVVVDYMSVMQPSSRSVASKDLWGIIGQVALELKGLAQRMKVPILTVMHVNADALKQKDERTFEVYQAALSRQPIKHCDLMFSWKIQDQEAFEVANIGYGVLAVKASRNSKYAETVLSVNTNIMRIDEPVINKII